MPPGMGLLGRQASNWPASNFQVAAGPPASVVCAIARAAFETLVRMAWMHPVEAGIPMDLPSIRHESNTKAETGPDVELMRCSVLARVNPAKFG